MVNVALSFQKGIQNRHETAFYRYLLRKIQCQLTVWFSSCDMSFIAFSLIFHHAFSILFTLWILNTLPHLTIYMQMMFAEVLGSGHRRDWSKVNVVATSYLLNFVEMINPAGIVDISMNLNFNFNYFLPFFFFFEVLLGFNANFLEWFFFW